MPGRLIVLMVFFGSVGLLRSLLTFAGYQTLGGSIIGDLFRPERRGFAMGMWNLGPLFGVFLILSTILTVCSVSMSLTIVPLTSTQALLLVL